MPLLTLSYNDKGAIAMLVVFALFFLSGLVAWKIDQRRLRRRVKKNTVKVELTKEMMN